MNERYLTAEQAKLIAQQSLEEIKNINLDNILKIINKEAKNGNMKVNYYTEIPKIAYDELIKLGYKIKDNYNQRDGYCYTISWN
jgi:hypothetical protein